MGFPLTRIIPIPMHISSLADAALRISFKARTWHFGHVTIRFSYYSETQIWSWLSFLKNNFQVHCNMDNPSPFICALCTSVMLFSSHSGSLSFSCRFAVLVYSPDTCACVSFVGLICVPPVASFYVTSR